MRFLADLQNLWRGMGRAGQIFAVCGLAALILSRTIRGPALALVQVPMVITGVILTWRGLRSFIRHSIWRLRNRLLVAYLFVALVPILLIATLVGVATWAMAGQTAVYLVTSEFDRRLDFLRGAALNLLRSPAANPAPGLQRLGNFFSERYPGLEIVLSGREPLRFPEEGTFRIPDASQDGSGVADRDGEMVGWIRVSDRGRVAMMVFPLTREFLNELVPALGEVSIVSFEQRSGSDNSKRSKARMRLSRKTGPVTVARVPEALNRFDFEVIWGSPIQVFSWTPRDVGTPALFTVRSRVSAVLKVLFSQKADWDNSWALILISTLGILFLLVEGVALVIGVSLSRSITSAVHNLYEGTERVMEGDFSHRIRLKGRDQLAALGDSFNRMTENVERLLRVAKEKERYEAELSIAREIQAQLYPRQVPASERLAVTALYKPARSVSGDYYDYRRIGPDKIAIAMGDVAGKGISAALLMATIQSAYRAEMQYAASNGQLPETAEVVVHLNQHLHANTPPEKFATFFLGIFDESASVLTYTNAGHLQPILVRDGVAQRLEVDGMVIGAFPFARYGTSRIELLPGDLLMLFTDGISEPENEYGEMFGEDRLAEFCVRNVSRPDSELLAMIAEAVEKWTSSDELQDDMTLLMARRI